MRDKVVFITGGASGIGLMTARELAAQGAHIVIFNRQADASLAARHEIEHARRDPVQRVASYLLDVADRLQVLAGFAKAAREIGEPDIVIHMAGIGGVAAMAEMDFAMFDRIIQINVYGTRNVAEAALTTMRARGRGTIVLAGSLGGLVPVYGYTAYGTSKFAVVGFAQCLRYELKPMGITVCCFCPGEVATPGLAAERMHTHPATTAMKFIGGTSTTQVVVRGLLSGIRRKQFLIIPGIRSKLVYWAQRWTPMVLWHLVTDAIIRRTVTSK